jgi:hypothetical protein
MQNKEYIITEKEVNQIKEYVRWMRMNKVIEVLNNLDEKESEGE